MNLLYAKTALYAYPNVDAVAEQIDEIVEKRALSSFEDFSPCERQCERIFALTEEKDVLWELKILTEKSLKKFTEEELNLLDYKYFKLKPREFFNNVDTSSRSYFRKQVRLADKFARALECAGGGDQWFRVSLKKVSFLSELYKRVAEYETASRKNKTAAEKAAAHRYAAAKAESHS